VWKTQGRFLPQMWKKLSQEARQDPVGRCPYSLKKNSYENLITDPAPIKYLNETSIDV
jgi:hypothetical protein